MSRLVADAIFYTCTLDHNPTKYGLQVRLSLMSCDHRRCRFVAADERSGMISILYQNVNEIRARQSQYNIIILNVSTGRALGIIIFYHGQAYILLKYYIRAGRQTRIIFVGSNSVYKCVYRDLRGSRIQFNFVSFNIPYFHILSEMKSSNSKYAHKNVYCAYVFYDI